MPLTGALLEASALQDTVSAAGEFPRALSPKASPSAHAAGDKNRGARGVKESPGLREAGARVRCRTSLISSRLRRFPALQLNPSQYLHARPSPALPAAGLPAAAPRCCQVGCPSAGPGGKVRDLSVGKYFKGHVKHSKCRLRVALLAARL